MSQARANAGKISGLLEAGTGHADLYRTIVAGPSGQRADLLVGRIRYLPDGAEEFEVIDMTGLNQGERAGYARRDGERWSMTAFDDSTGATSWVGWASSLAVGVDVLVNGHHAALGRHDSRRISGGTLTRP